MMRARALSFRWENRKVILMVLTLAWVGVVRGAPQTLLEETLKSIQFDQKVGESVPKEAPFTNESGETVTLGQCLQGRPVVLVLGYYECPMLCGMVLNGVVEALQELRARPGRDFDLVSLSIDPKETPELARAKKANYLKRYGAGLTGDGWSFLVGPESSAQQVADAVGFNYAYDPARDEYAHPSGFVVLTPDGVISRYFFGVRFSAEELAQAIKVAGAKKAGGPVEQLVLLCFRYNPLRGKHAPLIMLIVRVSGGVTVLGLAGAILYWGNRGRRAAASESDFNTGRECEPARAREEPGR